MRALTIGFALLVAAVSPAAAQTPPPPSFPPPMYSPLNTHAQENGVVEGFEVHRLRDYQITVIVPVSPDDLRNIIPEGYAVPDIAFASLIFVFQERVRVTDEGAAARPGLAAGTSGPFDAFYVLTGALNTQKNEVHSLLLESVRNETAADLDDEIFGAGSVRAADRLKVELETDAPDGLMNVKGLAECDELSVKIEAKNIPATTWLSSRNLLGGFFQQLDTSAGTTARPTLNQKIRTAAGNDAITVPPAHWTVTLPDNELRLRIGKVRVTGPAVAGAVGRWQELLQKFFD